MAGPTRAVLAKPGKRDPLGIGEDGLDRGERSGWGGSGHRAPPGQAGTGKAGPDPAPAVQRKPNVSRPVRSRYADADPPRKCSIPPTMCGALRMGRGPGLPADQDVLCFVSVRRAGLAGSGLAPVVKLRKARATSRARRSGARWHARPAGSGHRCDLDWLVARTVPGRAGSARWLPPYQSAGIGLGVTGHGCLTGTPSRCVAGARRRGPRWCPRPGCPAAACRSGRW